MKYKLNLETIPTWGLVITFSSFFIFFGLFVTFGVVGPAPYSVSSKSLSGIDPESWQKFLRGGLKLEVLQDDLKTVNSQFYFFVSFYKPDSTAALTGFSQDLSVNITLSGKNPDGSIVPITPEGTSYSRSLSCRQGSTRCVPMLLLNLNSIRYNAYIVQFTLLNGKPEWANSLLAPKMDADLIFSNWEYSFYELCFRAFFVAMTLFILLFFVAFTRYKQPWSEWHTEQKWIVFLLLMLILYNNPLYVMQFFSTSAGSIYSFLNIIFRVSFISFLLLILLVNTHSMYTKPVDRTFLKFYLPKVAVVGCAWYILMLGMAYVQFQNDPAFSFSDDVKSFKIVLGFEITLMILYVLMLFYYLIRLIGLYRNLPRKYSSKFLIVWGMTLFILVLFGGIVMILYIVNLMTPAVGFLSFQVIFNYYVFILAYLFLPSWQKEEITTFELEKDPTLDL